MLVGGLVAAVLGTAARLYRLAVAVVMWLLVAMR